MDFRGLERLDEALPLKGLLIRLHGEGDINVEYEREIDLGCGQPRSIREPCRDCQHRNSDEA